jgi:uncharacterized protein YjiS (DUF1127 family)
MRYERPWHGDAVATPVCGWLALEDGSFEGLRGGWWDQVEYRADRSDADLAAVKERIRHLEPVRATHPGHRSPAQDSAVAERAATKQTDFTDRPKWGISVISILTALWSRIRRHHEIHRMKAAWETVDDRILEDIGVSRNEIEYVRDA